LAVIAPVLLLLAMTALPSITFAAPPQAPQAQVTPEADDGDAERDQADDDQGEGDQGEDPPVEGDTIAAPVPGTASISVNKFECLADYGNDQSQYISYCFPPSSAVEFQVYGPNFTQFYQGGFAEANLEPGVFSIREIVPQGWSQTVFCQKATTVLNGGGSQEVVIYDGYYEVEVLGGEYLYCDWFNVPTVSADLTVNKHFCPAVTDEFDAYEADIFELAAECQEAGPPADFTVSQASGEIGTDTAEGDLPLATFSQFTPGQTTISEELPEGYGEPIVSCGVNDGLGNDIAGSALTPVDNDRITWQVGSGHAVFCDWYNVPSDEYGSISVTKITCPESEGYVGGGYDWYSARCTETTADVSFKLDGASTGNPGSQPTDANGQVTWDQREADTYFLSEEPPEDGPSPYGRPVVFCSYYLPAALQDRQWEAYEVDDEGRITFDLEDGQFIACVWFNLYDDEYGSVTVLKITCPEEMAYAAGGYDYYLSECEERTPDVSFKLDGEGTGNPGSQLTDANGWATWGEREPDTFYLTEEVLEDGPSPYGRPMVFCSYYDPAGGERAWEEYALDAEGRVTFELAYQQDITCTWFNLYEDEYGSVTVYKYTCAEDFVSAGGSYEYYLSECPEWTADVSFKLDGASTGNPGSQVTDDDGKAVWNEREADTYYLTEEEPEDGPSPYGVPAVYCSFPDPESSGDPEWDAYSTDDEGRVQFELAHQQDVTCAWFNLYGDAPTASPSPSSRPSASPSASPRPTTTGPGTTGPGTTGPSSQTGPATLIVQKYDCEEGYDWREDEADPAEECTERPDGIVFQLDVIRTSPSPSPSPVPQRAETSEEAPEAARFGGLRAGEYRLTELDLAEGTVAFILTCESTVRDFEDYPYYPFALAAADGSVDLTLVAGETLECAWYNVPPEPEDDEDGQDALPDDEAKSGNPDEDDDADYDGLQLQVYACEGEEQSVEACDPQSETARYALIPVNGGDTKTLETDANGQGRVAGLDGVYTLVQVGQQPCVVESPDVDAQGNLSLSAGKETLVRVFNCA
jgi:hypothetical protein